MKKRVFSFVLAALLLTALSATAAASGAADLTEKAWDLALDLKEAPVVVVDCNAELDGDVASGEYADTIHAGLNYEQGVIAGGIKSTTTKVTVFLPDSATYEIAIGEIPDQGAFYMIGGADGDQMEKYESVPAAAFGDPSVLQLHFAALGDDKLGAETKDEVLAYTMEGDELKTLVVECCPQLTADLEALDWSGVTAEVETDPVQGTISITSPSLGQAVLASMENIETVENAKLTLKITVSAVNDETKAQTLADQLTAQMAEYDGTVTEMTGEGYVPESLAEVVWAACEPEWSEVTGRESDKAALREALAGGAAEEEEPAAEEESTEG